MTVIQKLWRASLPLARMFFLFHLVHLQLFALRALRMLLGPPEKPFYVTNVKGVKRCGGVWLYPNWMDIFEPSMEH